MKNINKKEHKKQIRRTKYANQKQNCKAKKEAAKSQRFREKSVAR